MYTWYKMNIADCRLGIKCRLIPKLSLCQIHDILSIIKLQYCANVMQANFGEIPGFSWLFQEISLETTILRGNFPAFSWHLLFWMIIRFAPWFTPKFRAIIRSSRKVAAIFRTIIRSSWKFDPLFIIWPRAFLKHRTLTAIYKWPFQFLGTKESKNSSSRFSLKN